ncbi:MAG: molecular chaperone DnaJ [Rariglobus sp.]|nr:molecular chaperone DnaJ [Rariglobus sp.]
MSAPRSAHFAAMVAKQPDNELFRFSLAQALLAEDRPADALEHLEACARKKADWMMPRIMLGKTLLALGRRADAKPWLEDALQLAVSQDHQDPEAELRGLLTGL